jgi:hypothetical protein
MLISQGSEKLCQFHAQILTVGQLSKLNFFFKYIPEGSDDLMNSSSVTILGEPGVKNADVCDRD